MQRPDPDVQHGFCEQQENQIHAAQWFPGVSGPQCQGAGSSGNVQQILSLLRL